MTKNNEVLYNQYSVQIDSEIKKKEYQWQMSSMPSLDFEDIAQKLRLHIYNKIHLYNPSSGIEKWLSVLINNQLKNLWKNLYINYNKPCLSCACIIGEDQCSIYGMQSNNCPLFKNWNRFKVSIYNTKLPLPISNHEQEVFDIPSHNFDIEKSGNLIHEYMKKNLNKLDYEIYSLLFLENKSEEEIKLELSKLLDISDSKANAVYTKYKKDFIAQVKNLMSEDKIEIFYN